MLCARVWRAAGIVFLVAGFLLGACYGLLGQEVRPADPGRADPAPAEPPVTPDVTDRVPPVRMLAATSPVLRLASVPNMFGDVFNSAGQLLTTGNATSLADLPLAGGCRRVKIAENNKALPMNRCYFLYNHFHNALEADPDTTALGSRSFSVDRYTVGLERTFADGCWSVELRMPFADSLTFATPGYSVRGGEVGNLAVSFKRLLAATETGTLVAGLGIDTPTGSDVTGWVPQTTYTVRNESVHLLPYVGFMRVPNGCAFYHGFAQVDVPLGGNRIDYYDANLVAPGTFGTLTDQTLLYLDFSAGYWLYRNPCSYGVTGLASLVEFHYTTTLEDADALTGSIVGTNFRFGNRLNRVDVANLTVGLHAEIGDRTTLRVGGVFPLENDADKPFDAEFQISVNRRF